MKKTCKSTWTLILWLLPPHSSRDASSPSEACGTRHVRCASSPGHILDFGTALRQQQQQQPNSQTPRPKIVTIVTNTGVPPRRSNLYRVMSACGGLHGGGLVYVLWRGLVWGGGGGGGGGGGWGGGGGGGGEECEVGTYRQKHEKAKSEIATS